jgi:DNA-binding transcriptional ArsR family regulator
MSVKGISYLTRRPCGGIIPCMKLHIRQDEETAVRPLAELNKALAHPTRILLLQALAQGEACVCHLTCVLRKPQPYISQQLGVLRDAGLVLDRRDGQVIYYRLAADAVLDLIELGRQIARAQGQEIELPELPAGRIIGCHCPHCEPE